MPAVQTATSLSDILRWWATQMRGWQPRRHARAPRPVLALTVDADAVPRMALRLSDYPDASSTDPSGFPASPSDRTGPAVRSDALPDTAPPTPGRTERAAQARQEDARDPARLRALAQRAGGRIVIAVPDDAMLDTMVDLPAAAERHLADILRFDIDRVTPFRSDEVIFGIGIGRRLAGKIVIPLRLVPEAVVGPARAALEQAGLRARAIVSDRDGRVLPLDASRAGMPRTRTGIAIACAAVLLAAPFLHQQIALHETAQLIDDATPATRLATGLRTRLDRALHGPAALAAEERATGRLPDILARLSDALPDDTYLTALTLKRRHLEFNGLSADAPALIGRLDAAHFANATLSGPVLRTPDGRRDVFSARADLPADPAR